MRGNVKALQMEARIRRGRRVVGYNAWFGDKRWHGCCCLLGRMKSDDKDEQYVSTGKDEV
jgi:hypothetical protein